jgi:hypothetical protein
MSTNEPKPWRERYLCRYGCGLVDRAIDLGAGERDYCSKCMGEVLSLAQLQTLLAQGGLTIQEKLDCKYSGGRCNSSRCPACNPQPDVGCPACGPGHCTPSCPERSWRYKTARPEPETFAQLGAQVFHQMSLATSSEPSEEGFLNAIHDPPLQPAPPMPTLMGETSAQVCMRVTLKRAETAEAELERQVGHGASILAESGRLRTKLAETEAKLAVINRIVTDTEGAVPGDTLSTVRHRQARAYRRILDELRPRPAMGVKT